MLDSNEIKNHAWLYAKLQKLMDWGIADTPERIDAITDKQDKIFQSTPDPQWPTVLSFAKDIMANMERRYNKLGMDRVIIILHTTPYKVTCTDVWGIETLSSNDYEAYKAWQKVLDGLRNHTIDCLGWGTHQFNMMRGVYDMAKSQVALRLRNGELSPTEKRIAYQEADVMGEIEVAHFEDDGKHSWSCKSSDRDMAWYD